MNINIFDSTESVIKYDSKFIHLRSYIFVADTVTLTTRDVDTNLFAIDIETLSDEMSVAVGKLWLKGNDEFKAVLLILEETLPIMKKTRAMKHKDKRALYALGSFKQTLVELRRGINLQMESCLRFNKVVTLRSFIEEKVWNFANLNVFPDPKKEDGYIQLICDSILHQNNFMGLDEILAEKYVSITLDNEDSVACDFIKIPLWDIPVDEGMASDKIKYTRSDMQTAMKPFKAHLNELKEELNEIQFEQENISEIKNRLREKILEHVIPVQQAIDNSIYLSHQRNQSQDDTRSKLYLGISSSAMLIDYLEKFEVIAPYVASEVRERLAKQMDLKATRLFFYQEVNPTHWFVHEGEEMEQPPKVT